MSKWYDIITDYVTFQNDAGEVPRVLCSVSDETFNVLDKLCVTTEYSEENEFLPQDYDTLIIEDGGLPHREFCPQVDTILFTSDQKENAASFENTLRSRKVYVSHYIESEDGTIVIKSKNTNFINKLTHPTGTVSIPEPEVINEEEVPTTQPPKEEKSTDKSDWLNRWST